MPFGPARQLEREESWDRPVARSCPHLRPTDFRGRTRSCSCTAAVAPSGFGRRTFAQRLRSAGRARDHSSRTPSSVNASAPSRAITTRSMPSGTKPGHKRKHSRQTRLIRFRIVASPTLRVATMPRRDGARAGMGALWLASRALTSNTKWRLVARSPFDCTRKKSARRRMRRSRPNPNEATATPGKEAEPTS